MPPLRERAGLWWVDQRGLPLAYEVLPGNHADKRLFEGFSRYAPATARPAGSGLMDPACRPERS